VTYRHISDVGQLLPDSPSEELAHNAWLERPALDSPSYTRAESPVKLGDAVAFVL